MAAMLLPEATRNAPTKSTAPMGRSYGGSCIFANSIAPMGRSYTFRRRNSRSQELITRKKVSYSLRLTDT